MSSDKSKNVLGDLEGTVGNVHGQLDVIQQFMSRRFDELSMEINATSQQIDMNDEGLSKRFGEILEILGAISYNGEGLTPANTGVELEAVIEDTEKAANTILDAADRIVERIEHDEEWRNPDTQEAAKDKIKQDVQDILMACTFQDLAGQRIRNTLDNLQLIETRLSGTLEKLGIDVSPSEEDITQKAQGSARSDQGDIDSMF